jgi:hypothetical protein
VTEQALKQAAILSPHLRFQVSLPTPLVTILALPLEQQPLLLPKYEARLLEKVRELATSIPPEELAIQWDTAVEFSILEGVWRTFLGSPSQARGPITDMLRRIGNSVPEPIELGYHLCYGDAGHQHFIEPRDAGLLVEVANAVFDGLRRPVSWLHLPVPRARDDAAYSAPLATLGLPPATELYLGLIHLTDGAAGASRRIAAAQPYVQHEFGVAAECGLGRRDPAVIPAMLALHAQVAEPIAEDDAVKHTSGAW